MPLGLLPLPERGAHRWMSDPSEGLPVWLELAWDTPVKAAEVQLIFDAGMHRPLTLTHSDAYVDRMEWGGPQPETIRDYLVEAKVNGTWQTLVEVRDNYQRRCVHTFQSATLSAVRVTVTATNGLDHARIGEVRVY